MDKFNILSSTPFYPAVVALEVTLRCNMKCLHCGSGADGSARKNELDLKQWLNVVDQLSEMKTQYITLSGGEPFVWPHWRELCAHIKKRGLDYAIISNGYNILDDDILFLKDAGICNIALSIDGTSRTHNKIRQKSDSFERVVETAKKFIKAGARVAVSTSVNKLNIHDLSALMKLLAECEINLWQVQIVNTFGRAGTMREKMLISTQEYKDVIRFINDAQTSYKTGDSTLRVMPADSIGYCHGISDDVWGELKWSGCNAGRYVLGSKSNGDVVGCLSLQSDTFLAGNVLLRPISDIWRDEHAFRHHRGFKSSMLAGSCKKCSEGERCRGGCLSMGYSITGELYHNPYCYKSITEAQINVTQ